MLSSEQEAALGHLAYGAAEVRAASGEHSRQEVGDLDCYPKASKPGRPRLAENLRNTWQARKFQQRAAVRIAKAEEMMQEVRGFGRYPMESRQDVRERQLADKLRKARKAKRFSPAQEAELQALQQAARDAIAEARIARADELMQQVRDFGRYPKASKHVASRERRLAQNLRKARKEKLLSPEQESELQVLQQAEMDSRAAARMSEAQRPLDPMERLSLIHI